MLQEKIERMPDQPLRVVRPATAAQPPADDPRVDLKELIRVMQRRRKIILWVAAVPVLLALALRPLRDAALHDLDADPDRPARPPHRQQRGHAGNSRRRRRRRGGGEPASGHHLRHGAAPRDRARAPRHRSGIRRAGDRPRGPDARRARDRRHRRRGRRRRTQGAAPAQEAHRREALRQGLRRRSLCDRAKAARNPCASRTRSRRPISTTRPKSRASAAGRASAALGGRLDALRTRVQEAEDRVVQYKEQHKLVAAGNVLVSDQQLSEMTLQLNTARGKTAEARARYDQIIRARQSGVESGAIPEAVLSQTIGQLRTQYAEVARQRAELGALVGPRHPSITNLDAQIQGVQKLINEELSRIATAARSDLERTQASEKALEAESRGAEAEGGRDQPGLGAAARTRARSRGEPRDLSGVPHARARNRRAAIDRQHQCARDFKGDAAARQELAAAPAAARGRAGRRSRHRHRRRTDARIFRRERLFAPRALPG